MGRREELAAALGKVQSRIGIACDSCGRDPAEITLVVVTKYFPVDDLVHLASLGVRHIGENRSQEAEDKLDRLKVLAPEARAALTVHFIGQLQTNKAVSVARYADVVHSVDRIRLVEALERGAERTGRSMDVLVQVSLDGQQGRGGIDVAGLPRIAERVAQSTRLHLRGVMAVAPPAADADSAFSELAAAATVLRSYEDSARVISAGMSSDLEAAIRHGSTLLRVGSAILGTRTPTG
ncbi:hypothetical protein SAMN05421595_1600 [Austwickia chelonae]|nr:hypothetical protein SAMN05421595_1600 [Austwickia chelonae]